MGNFLLTRKAILPALVIVAVMSALWVALFNLGIPSWTSSWETTDTMTCPVEVVVTDTGMRANVVCSEHLNKSYSSGNLLERVLYRGSDEVSCTVRQNSNSGEQRLSCSPPA